jgi:hypothetical protein
MFVFCDVCTNIGDHCDPSRREVWNEAKAQGWKRVDGMHVCPDCVAAETGKEPQ